LADSSISKFFEKDRDERVDIVAKFCNLSKEEVETLKNSSGISYNEADAMVENAIGTLSFPLGIATNFQNSLILSSLSFSKNFEIEESANLSHYPQ